MRPEPPRREVYLTATSQVSALLAFRDTHEGPAPVHALAPRPARGSGPRVLVGGVGYTCLGDLSVGPTLIERLLARSWPPGVVVEDLSYGPIDVLFRLQASPPFSAAVLVTAVLRGRVPGSLHRVRWVSPRPSRDEVQARVAEAISGVISLDNLLCILDHFGALPPEVIVLEVEPLEETWGLDFSPPVLAALDQAEAAIHADVERLLRQEAPA